MTIRKPSKKAQNQEEKTAAIPALQKQGFYIPPSQKKNEPMIFDKTAVVNALASEAIVKETPEVMSGNQEKQQTMVLKELDIPKSRLRKERPQEKTSSVFWIAFAVIILLFAIFIVLFR